MGRRRGHHHPSYCRECGATREQAGRISQTGKCEPCGRRALNDAHEQLRAREGPAFDAWCYGLIEYASGLLERALAADASDADGLTGGG